MPDISQFYDQHFARRLRKRPTISKRILFNETIRRIEQALGHSEEAEARTLLDVGCGAGHLIARLVGDPRLRCTGIDITRSVIDALRERYPQAEFQQLDFTRPGAAERRFDLVTAVEVLEHIPYEQQAVFVENLAASLAPGGLLVLTTPNLDRAHRIPRAFRNTQPVEDWVGSEQLRDLLAEHFRDITIESCIWHFPNRVADALFKRLLYPFHMGPEQRMLQKSGLGAHLIATAQMH